MENAIVTIINSNLTEEQKEALLKELANESIKKQQAENSFETKREQLIEKNRQKAQETRDRLEQYQKEAYKKEIITNSDKEVQKYIEELSKIKNNRGEYIYKDLELEYKDGKITKEEIYDLYERFLHGNREVVYEDVFKDIKDMPEKEFQGPLSLEAAAEAMTIDEMNTILNMVSSGTKDEEILNNIANRLGVSPNSLEEIAKFKEKNQNKFAKASQNGEVNQSNDNPEPVSSVKPENPVKMIGKKIKNLTENRKQKVREIKTSKPNLIEKIKAKVVTSIEKIKDKITEFRENREVEKANQEPITNIDKVNNLEDDINKYSNLSNEEQTQVKIPEEVDQKEAQSSIPAETPILPEPENQSLENKTDANLLNDIVANSGLKGVQETPDLTADEIYKVAGFSNPKAR